MVDHQTSLITTQVCFIAPSAVTMPRATALVQWWTDSKHKKAIALLSLGYGLQRYTSRLM